jgi:tripartite-type tricarboxylate transporter receptor subunit TctC
VVLVVNPKVPAKDAKEFAALLKARNGDMTYASGGNGTILHLASAMFLDEAKVAARHIPYKGVGPMLTDLIGGQVDFATAALPSVQQHLKSGALRAIGMATSQRVPAAPDIPTFVEQGLPGYVVEAWFAVVGAQGPARGRRAAHARRAGEGLCRPRGEGAMAARATSSTSAPRQGHALLPQRNGAKYAALVKKAGVEAQ